MTTVNKQGSAVSTRAAIPVKIKQNVMYDSLFSCAICQIKGAHIHHIDKNNSNNDPDNLVLLCQIHHDEAHTKRELSLNLTPERIRDFRNQWYKEVRETRKNVASSSGQIQMANEFLRVGITWGYINHSRLIHTVPKELIDQADQRLFSRLKRSGILDERGLLINPKNFEPSGSYIVGTVYDRYDHLDSIALHVFYSELVDLFSTMVEPVHLDESNWSKKFIKQMIRPGSIIFLNRSQYFHKVHEDSENAEVAVQAFKRKIKILYRVNTRNMYGTTSITVSFSGHKSCASLLQVKSINKEGLDLVINCTPIALGVSFHEKVPELLGKRGQRPARGWA